MANPQDSVILDELIRLHYDPAALIEAAERLLPDIRDDSIYWQLLLTVYVDNGRLEDVERWRRLFQAKRRNRMRAMKKADRKAWRALPDPVTCYRAVALGEDPSKALSWSLNLDFLQTVYPNRRIVSATIPKARVAFYVNRRREGEIIVL